MDASLLGRLAALSVLLLLLAGTSAAHAALLKLNRGRIRHLAAEGVPRARSVASLVDDAVSVETTLAAANAAVIAMGAITLVLLAGDDPADTLGAFYGIGAGGLLIMVWVHLASRAAGSSRPEDTIHLLRWPLRVLHLLFKPLMLLLQQVVRRVIPDEPRPASAGTFAADHDFWMIDATTEEDRSLEAEEKEWIHGIFEMGGTTAREIMVPRWIWRP